MTFKTVAATVLLLGVAGGSEILAKEQDTMTASGKVQAEQRARAQLAEQLRIAPDQITVTRSEPQTWSDSSMGCGKPGTIALTVITEGYAVVLSAEGREHTVHVSGSNAVICSKGAMPHRDGRATNARGLDVMMERARQDLAQRLGVDPAQIRIAGMRPQRWDDSALGCPQEGEAIRAGPVDGFRLALRYSGRIYTYHTDRRDVRPCPAIESH
jgi:hypothetical protein